MQERGSYGRWLVQGRQARRWTQEQARQAVAASGHPIAASVYASYESGTKVPSRKDLPALERFWGPASERPEATETNDAVAEAIDRQTAVLERLFGEWLSRWPRPDEALEAEAEAAIESTSETLQARRPRPLRTGP